MHSPDLRRIVERGATRRRHRFWRDLTGILPIAGISAGLQALIYVAVMLNAGRDDWINIVTVLVALALVQLVSAATLVSLRRQEFPITVATVVAIVMFNFAVAALSALRIPVSYTGLLLCAPIAVVLLVYGNVRHNRKSRETVAILDFDGAESVKARLGKRASIVRESGGFQPCDVVLVDGDTHHSPKWSRMLTRYQMTGAEMMPWFRYIELRHGRVEIDNFDISHMSFSASQIYYSQIKRGFDIALAVAVLPLAAVLMALIASYIAAIDGRPVFFRQERRGYAGTRFTLLKFRTMVRDAHGQSALANDSRVIRGCHFLRQTRLDELPQILNIVRGEMSWIGPRPVAVPIAEALEIAVPQYAMRQLVLPGLTGWAQVSHGYAASHAEEIEKLSYDLYYVKELSFDLDILILAKTIRIILTRMGAR